MTSVLTDMDQRSLVFAGVFAGLGLLAVYKRYSSPNTAESPTQGARHTPAAEKAPINPQQHEPGEWTPVPFDYPTITPCAEDPRNIKPVPYRPFKWGEYHVTMGLRAMPWDEWFELDNTFVEYHRIRERRLRTRGDRLVQVLPSTPGLVNGGHDAAVELVQEMAEFLSRRYPTTYSVKRGKDGDTSGWYGLPRITEISIIPTGRTYKVDEEEPMALAGIIAQDDIAIMIEGSDGQYYFQAGSVLIPGMWRLKDKIGMSLDDIHFSGTVPQYESKLQLNMNRFFDRMPLDKPVTRANYSFQVIAPPEVVDPLDPNELSWAQTMKGDEEDEDNKPGYLRAKDDEALPSYSGGNGSPTVIADLANSTSPVDPSLVRMRVERETLRKLPRTGAIIFAIRTYLTPLEDLAAEPGIPGRLASAIRSWPEDVAVYKARTAYESVLGYLDERHAAQVAAGLASPVANDTNS